MKEIKTSIQLINHASVKISSNDISILSDPWYFGDAFHKGWNLLYELSDDEILKTLSSVTHIWISHEHPDHLSIPFFKKYKNKLINNNIEILFQKTIDRRVYKFLISQGLKVKELDFDKKINLSSSSYVVCIKDGAYDSGLMVCTNGEKILNLNDCVVRDTKRANEIKKVIGEVDVLLTQFSYAAWKGGQNNKKWRLDAAIEKKNSIEIQCNVFKPKVIIPFASYIYFSNEYNFYLNDDANKPSDLINLQHNSKTIVLKPLEKMKNDYLNHNNKESLIFWNDQYSSIKNKHINKYQMVSFDDLSNYFKSYQDRIFENNSRFFMKFLQIVSPISILKPINIELKDLNIVVEIDIFADKIIQLDENPDISMSSESLKFIFLNDFGYDTLTVNGCFEELKPKAFSKMSKILGIGNFNNIGILIRPTILLNLKLIYRSIISLLKVEKKLS